MKAEGLDYMDEVSDDMEVESSRDMEDEYSGDTGTRTKPEAAAPSDRITETETGIYTFFFEFEGGTAETTVELLVRLKS
jgi:hypothetical protein